MRNTRFVAIVLAWVALWSIAGALFGALGAFLGTLDNAGITAGIFLLFSLGTLIVAHMFDNLAVGVAFGGVPLAGLVFLVSRLYPGAMPEAAVINAVLFAIGASLGTLGSIRIE